jgi:hypothetical protein
MRIQIEIPDPEIQIGDELVPKDSSDEISGGKIVVSHMRYVIEPRAMWGLYASIVELPEPVDISGGRWLYYACARFKDIADWQEYFGDEVYPGPQGADAASVRNSYTVIPRAASETRDTEVWRDFDQWIWITSREQRRDNRHVVDQNAKSVVESL